MQFLGPVIIPRQTIRLGLETENSRRDYLRQVHLEHRGIFDALVRADARAARECTRQHLEAARDRYRSLVGT